MLEQGDRGGQMHNECDHAHSYPFSTVRINRNDGLASVNPNFPPVCWADGEITPCPEEQCRVSEEGHEHRRPHPYRLTDILFHFVLVANPASIL
jgi:hypothetical protein